MKISITLLILSIAFSSNLNAQKLKQEVKLTAGNLKQMKGQPRINIIFKYDKLVVGNETTEPAFVQMKKTNWDTKEAGKGTEFEKQWYASKQTLYEDMFRYQFSKNVGIPLGDSTSACMVIVNIERIEPGWNAGAVAKHPVLEGNIKIVSKTENVTLAVVSFDCTGADHLGGDFEMFRRIQSAYFAAAKEIGAFIKSKF
jgi:hypothetical protein